MEGGELGGCFGGSNDLEGMRIESQSRACFFRFTVLSGLAQDGLMPAMNSIEIPDRHMGYAEMRWNGGDGLRSHAIKIRSVSHEQDRLDVRHGVSVKLLAEKE